MTSDPRAARARELFRQAGEHEELAGRCRVQAYELVRKLRDDGWTHASIASAIGCSKDLVTSIVMGRVGPGTRARRRG